MKTVIAKKANSRLKVTALLLPTAVVIAIYIIVPTVFDFAGSLVAAFATTWYRGVDVLESQPFQKYIGNLEGFFGEFGLLIGSGAFALWIWRRRNDLQIFPKRQWLFDVAIGTAIGLVDYYCCKRFVVPWLYLARPLGSEWIKPEYVDIGSYGQSYVNQIASVYFVDTVYVSLIETIIIIAFMYSRFRSQWSVSVSILLASAIFAGIHRNQLLFLEFFLFGLVNFGLFELRKSLAAPLVHHFTRNVLIYGSQLALFGAVPPG